MFPEWAGDLLAILGPLVLVLFALKWVWSRLHPAPPMDTRTAYSIPLPLPDGVWQAYNSPASKVPSHGTDWLGQRYAIDLVGIEPGAGHTPVHDLRARLWVEPPERFTGYGASVVAPADATVVSCYDGATDRHAMRSLPGLAWFFISSMALALITALVRTPAGRAAMAGNHIVLHLDGGPYLALMHLRRGSVRVRPGERVAAGHPLGQVGNTGNTTQPHLHVQLIDTPNPLGAKGVPMVFTGYEAITDSAWTAATHAIPRNGDCIRAAAPIAAPSTARRPASGAGH